MTNEQSASEIDALKSSVATLELQHASMVLFTIGLAGYIQLLTKFARQQGAVIDLAALEEECREITIKTGPKDLSAQLDAELTKLFRGDTKS